MMERTRNAIRAAAMALAVAMAGATALGQERPAEPRTIRATGEAVVTATPDQAEMTVAVTTQAPTAEQAAADNATKTERVTAALRSALEAGATLKTVGYSLSPTYVYPREGGEPKITGYTATNSVLVRTGDLKRVGALIDAAVTAGANNVQGLTFSIKDDAGVQAEALRQAARAAQRRAEAIAAGLGVTPSGVIRAEEGAAVVRPVMYDAAAVRTASAQTPVEPGNVEVRATVTVELAFSK